MFRVLVCLEIIRGKMFEYNGEVIAFHAQLVIFMVEGQFSIDGGIFFVEKSSLCEGRMATRSFPKTVRCDRESAVSSW